MVDGGIPAVSACIDFDQPIAIYKIRKFEALQWIILGCLHLPIRVPSCGLDPWFPDAHLDISVLVCPVRNDLLKDA